MMDGMHICFWTATSQAASLASSRMDIMVLEQLTRAWAILTDKKEPKEPVAASVQ